MFHIAICDDNPEQIFIIKKAADNYFKDGWEYDIVSFDNPLKFLESIEKKGGYDLVLLDICMPGILGTDVAREIRNRKQKTEIVFLTTSDEFAVDAFALKAAHYIVKPFTQDKFNEAMERVAAVFANNQIKKLPLKTEGGDLINIDINDIIYIQSNDHNQLIYLINNQQCCETRQSLSRIFEELNRISPGEFISPYKGYLVNQKFIVTIDSKCIQMRNGDKVPIPRGTFRLIQKQYLDYRFGDTNKKIEVTL